MAGKTRKSIEKRFKITNTGKVMRRPTGQDHFRAKKTGKQIRHMRGWIEVTGPEAKMVKKALHQ